MSSPVLFDNSNNNLQRMAGFYASVWLCIILLAVPGCGYKNPPGQWQILNSSALYFTGVELSADAVSSGYRDTCMEAPQEIEQALIKKLPAQIKPLILYTAKNPPPAGRQTAELKLLVTQCDIDVEQSGGSFTFYLSLPLRITVTENNQVVLDYPLKTYEQVSIDIPDPVYEFTFAEAVARTLLLFKGQQVWQAGESPLP